MITDIEAEFVMTFSYDLNNTDEIRWKYIVYATLTFDVTSDVTFDL